MPIPMIDLSTAPAATAVADAVVVFARTDDEGPVVLAPDGFAWVGDGLRALGATGSAEEVTKLPGTGVGPRLVAVAGVGSRADASSVRLAAGAALRSLSEIGQVSLEVGDLEPEVAAAALEGAVLGAYRYDEYRSEPKPATQSVTAHTPVTAEAIQLDRVRVLADAVARTRDLVNASPAELFPEAFAAIAVERAADLGVQARVWDEQALREDGFGGLIGVGQGSMRGPRLVRLEYAPDGAEFTLALVGKGITFDSGGLSLKPGASMVGMKGDMAGAATVLETIAALARLAVPIRVIGWMCLAENLPSGTALRPNDVLRIRGGKTVEVLNTDAEGRLVMADALVAASEEQPDAIIDVATLTGAQIVALGHRIVGLMGDDELVEDVRRAAASVDEAMWPMPLPDHLRPLLKSNVADLVNTKLGTVVPGMLLAGVFLREFVGQRAGDEGGPIPWAHLDIAGPADNTGAGWGFTGPGATGVAVRTLVRLSEQLSTR